MVVVLLAIMVLMIPRVNADVINTGLFSYFGTANYDFDSRFGVTGTIRRDASLDFLKQIDGVHLVRCRFWNIADEDFIKIQLLII
jgi:hypothetical protein